MALKLMVASLDEVDEKFHELYEETDDGYALKTDDSSYKAKLAEFRDNNRKLHKAKTELEAQMAKYKGVDLERYEKAQEALAKLEELEEKELEAKGDIEEIVKKRVATMESEHQKQVQAKNKVLEELTQERDNLRGRLGTVLIDTSVQNAINKVGKVRTGALDDVLHRARATWKIDPEGHMVAVDAHGEPIFGGKGDPLTPDEWASQLVNDAPHLFEPAGGGGAGGGSKGKGGGPGKRTISGNDPLEFGKNIDGILKGEVVVQD